jgi:hypothetical protein
MHETVREKTGERGNVNSWYELKLNDFVLRNYDAGTVLKQSTRV